MATFPILLPPIWPALPPEINTSRLMAGAGPAPMLQAAAGWEVLAVSLETQADELASSLVSLAAVWTGQASERAIAATTPMVIWLRMLSLQAMKRSLQAAAQATSYTFAMATTPPLPEIEMNHVTHAVLEATNFLEINRLPITLTELDYIRMWNQAAAVMDAYQAETALNVTFEPIAMPKPIVMPGVGEAAGAAGLGKAAAMAPVAAVRNAVITKVSAEAKVQTVATQTGRAVEMATSTGARANSEAQQAGEFKSLGQQDQMMQQGMMQGVQMATQMGSSFAQLPQQMLQGVTQPFQQMAQPLQQVSSMFGQMGMGNKGPQVGLYGRRAVLQPSGDRRKWGDLRCRLGQGGVVARRRWHSGAHAVDGQSGRLPVDVRGVRRAGRRRGCGSRRAGTRRRRDGCRRRPSDGGIGPALQKWWHQVGSDGAVAAPA